MKGDSDPAIIRFDEVTRIIDNARSRALKSVNSELINMYLEVGHYISDLCNDSRFGDSVIDDVAEFIEVNNPGIKGFTRSGLYRMKRFYEVYNGDKVAAPLLTQVNWSSHIVIMSRAKTAEERHFYLELSVKENYTRRELERQIDSSYYERYVLSAGKQLPERVTGEIRDAIMDSYVLEFLDLPKDYSEKGFRKAIISNLKDFILEFGKDFTFVDEEYRIQVGGSDFFIDLLFYNRALSCLVPIELKIGKFKPEHVGQINFYLEALDRDVRKPGENPSVGLVLCADKDEAVVEYALSRSLSPTLVSDYKLCLPDKKLLEEKLREITESTSEDDD